MPRVYVPGCDEDLGLWVGFNEFLGEGNGWPVADRLAMPQQLVPLLSAEFSLAVVLCGESILPHQAVWWVFHTSIHHVVGIVVAKLIESDSESWRTIVSSQEAGE